MHAPNLQESTLQAPADRRLDAGTKIFYGLGSVSFGVKDAGFSALLLLFYNQVMGLPATWVGLALIISLAIDVCTDPLIGHASDRFRSNWGRRHPFMYVSALPIALSYAALWNPPDLNQQGLFIYLLVLAVFVRIFISVYEIPSLALTAEFSADYDERSVLLAYRNLFAMLGAVTVVGFAFAFLLKADENHPVGQLNPAGYVHYGILASIVMFIAVLVSSIGTHKCIPTLMSPPPRKRQSLAATFAEARETLSNRSFVFVLLASIAMAMAMGLQGALSNYFATFFWGFSAQHISFLTLGILIASFTAFAITPPLARRFSKRGIVMTALVLAGIFTIGPIVLRLMGLMPPNGSARLVAVIFANSIIMYVCTVLAWTMTISMIADVVDDSALKTGRRSEGLFFSAMAFVSKSISGLGLLAASIVIDVVGLHAGLVPANVPAATLQRLAFVFVPTILGLYIVGSLLITGYSITRASHQETMRRLAEGSARNTSQQRQTGDPTAS